MLTTILISLVVKGVVGLSSVYVRQAPDYESPLETQELMGTLVEILESRSHWVRITTPQPYEGWVTSLGIVPLDSAAFEAYSAAPKYICIAKNGSVLQRPSDGSEQLCDLVAGDVLRVSISACGKDVKKGPFLGVTLPDGRRGWVRKSSLSRLDKWQETNSELTADQKVAKVVKFARSLLGTPYLWGGMTTCGTDCSGLSRLSYLMVGASLPRNASQQIKCGKEIDAGDMDSWKEGDLVFFGNKSTGRPSHVGIYLGKGKMIHSSMCVRINSLQPQDPDYYSNAPKLIAVRRILE